MNKKERHIPEEYLKNPSFLTGMYASLKESYRGIPDDERALIRHARDVDLGGIRNVGEAIALELIAALGRVLNDDLFEEVDDG